MALTTITDTLYRPNGLTFEGTITVTLAATSSQPLYTGTKTLTGLHKQIPVSGGAVTISLEPNDAITPAGTSYQARYAPSQGSPYTETWVVPTSASPVTVHAVRVATTPTPDVVVSLSQLAQGGATADQVLAWDGTHWAPAAAAGGSNVVQRATRVITTAELEAMPTTEVELVPAPGAEKFLVVNQVVVSWRPGSTPSADHSNGIGPVVGWSNVSAGLAEGSDYSQFASFAIINTSIPQLVNVSAGVNVGLKPANTDSTLYENQPLVFNLQPYGKVNAISIASAGTGYTVGDVLTISGDGGDSAAVTVLTVNGGGGITSLAITETGSGYTWDHSNISPRSLTGGTGSDAAVYTTSVQSLSGGDSTIRVSVLYTEETI